MLGLTGTNETADFNGEPVLCAYGPLPNAGLGLEVKLSTEEFLDGWGRAGWLSALWPKRSPLILFSGIDYFFWY